MTAPSFGEGVEVYWDRVSQGALDGLAAGLLVREGDHWLVMLNAEPNPEELAVRVHGRRLGNAVDVETGDEHEMGHGPGGARLTVRLEAGDARAFRVEEIG